MLVAPCHPKSGQPIRAPSLRATSRRFNPCHASLNTSRHACLRHASQAGANRALVKPRLVRPAAPRRAVPCPVDPCLYGLAPVQPCQAYAGSVHSVPLQASPARFPPVPIPPWLDTYCLAISCQPRRSVPCLVLSKPARPDRSVPFPGSPCLAFPLPSIPATTRHAESRPAIMSLARGCQPNQATSRRILPLLAGPCRFMPAASRRS